MNLSKIIIFVLITLALSSFSMAVAQQEPPVLQAGQVPPFQTGQGLSPMDLLKNVSNAIATAKQASKYFTSGNVWIQRAPAGEIVIKAAIVYQNVAVGVLDFSPIDGTILPCGYHPSVFDTAISLNTIKQKLPSIIANLYVLNGAEFREREYCWAIPVAYNNKIVAHVRISYDGIHVVPDYPATQEMKFYGK